MCIASAGNWTLPLAECWTGSRMATKSRPGGRGRDSPGSMNGAIGAKQVTYDFARLMDGVDPVPCSGFGDAVIAHM